MQCKIYDNTCCINDNEEVNDYMCGNCLIHSIIEHDNEIDKEALIKGNIITIMFNSLLTDGAHHKDEYSIEVLEQLGFNNKKSILSKLAEIHELSVDDYLEKYGCPEFLEE